MGSKWNWKTSVAGLLFFVFLNSEEIGIPARTGKFLAGAMAAAGFAAAADAGRRAKEGVSE